MWNVTLSLPEERQTLTISVERLAQAFDDLEAWIRDPQCPWKPKRKKGG
jgi:hypothetical protein